MKLTLKQLRGFAAGAIASLVSAVYLTTCAPDPAHAQIVNPSQPATGVPTAGAGISVSGQQVSINYGLASQTYTGGITSATHTLTAPITGSQAYGAFNYGTLGFADTGIFSSWQTSVNSYTQFVLQNTNAGAAASTGYLVSNDQGTATAHYGEFGINSSAFSGTGSLNLPGATYLTATTGDLAIGTTSANAIHFTVNSGATDSLAISGTGVVSGVGLDNYIAAKPVTQTVLNVAALRTATCVGGQIFHTQGYSTIADGGAGDYVCNSADTSSTDNGCNIIASAGGARFYLQYSQGVTVRQCGATG